MQRVDLVIKDVLVFNSYFKRFIKADVHTLDGRIYYIDTKRQVNMQAEKTIDGTGKYMIPGLVDVHMHIESSLMTPEPFCGWLASCGVTTIVSEPHEIANVRGVKGISEMIYAGNISAIDVFFGIPSSVPSTNGQLETVGESIDFKDMKALLQNKNVVCVGEVMNYCGIIRENDLEITKFLKYLRENHPYFVIEGHCPSLLDLDLAKYLYLGINGDHTEHTLEEIEQRFCNGMYVEIQDKMLKPEVLNYIRENDLYEHCGFVTDDTMPDALYESGHLNAIVKKAMALGFTPENAIYCATYTNARRMNLTDRGAIAPGKLADFILLDDLRDFSIHSVYKNGKNIFHHGASGLEDERGSYVFPEDFYHSVNVKPLSLNDFKVTVQEDVDSVIVTAIEVMGDATHTKRKEIRLPVKNHEICWQESECLLIMSLERHGRNGNIGYGFITGDCIKRGAVATTCSHDHHNLTVIGDSPEAMLLAVERIKALQGGIVTVDEGKVQKELQLRVCGIISDGSIKEIGSALKAVRGQLVEMGYRHYNPITSLCTLSLPVSPVLKITDKGLIDVNKGCVVPAYRVD